MSQEDSTGLAVARVSDIGASGGRTEEHSRLPREHRFRLGLYALLGLGAAALISAVVLSVSGRMTAGAGDWSVWSPTTNTTSGAQQIADFVAPYYRATPAEQLAVVTTVNLNDPNHPLQVVVPGSSGSTSSLVPLPPDSTIVYNLCGEGSSDCSIGVGSPSSARLLLLKREALELALYTFKYISGANTVVAILPPGRTGCVGICPKPPDQSGTTKVDLALAFDHSELQPWLDHPLRAALPEPLPPTVSQMENAPEAELVSVITAHGLFQERQEQAQDGSSVVLLSPEPPS
ncbi:MAG TPA: hypothetical protein VGF70_06445 [Solirubrobacteraceae bacterium]|jgi:hypothetical protein